MASGSRHELVNAKATTKYLELDAVMCQCRPHVGSLVDYPGRIVSISETEKNPAWFSRSCFTKSEDKLPKVPLLKYYTYNLGATAQVLSAGGPGLTGMPGPKRRGPQVCPVDVA
jgi:hypothetical protein